MVTVMAPREQGHLHGHGDVPGGDGGKVHQLGHVAHQNTLKFYGQSNGDINKVARVFVTNIMLILVSLRLFFPNLHQGPLVSGSHWGGSHH